MKTLTCPACGWDAKKEGLHDFCFRHLEEVTTERRVVGINETGVLEVESAERIQLEDDGEKHRLQCGNCLHEFELPEGIQVDFA